MLIGSAEQRLRKIMKVSAEEDLLKTLPWQGVRLPLRRGHYLSQGRAFGAFHPGNCWGGANGEGRTPMALRPLDPKSSASASSATLAFGWLYNFQHTRSLAAA